MGTRGRHSTAELTVVKGPLGAVAQRPDPPKDLNGAEAIEWCAIVASMQPGYFAGSHYASLKQLCRHAVGARRISQLIATCLKQKKTDIKEYCRLLALQRQETVMIMRLMQQMRLSHQATYRADSAKNRPALGPPLLFKPWDRQ